MADIKCSRCDRYYSMFRSRCPYCGTLRSSKGKKATNNDNAKWKVFFGIAIFVVLIGAVAAILITTYSTDKPQSAVTDVPNADAGGVTSQEGEEQVMSPEGVYIAYAEEIKTDISIKLNQTIVMYVMYDPWDYQGGCVWSTSDSNVITVAQDGTVLAVGMGTATLIATAGEKVSECIIRVY